MTIASRGIRDDETTTNGMQEGAGLATAERGTRSLDRVTAPDLMLIWPEEEGWPQEIGALATLDGGSLFDADGEFRLGAARETIGRRLHLVPRFRQVLYWPKLGLGWPVWGDAQSFDITQHVRTYQVPAPGDERQLLLACERLRRRPLHRGRPLWEMWFLTGLADDRVGFFIKMHHAAACSNACMSNTRGRLRSHEQHDSLPNVVDKHLVSDRQSRRRARSAHACPPPDACDAPAPAFDYVREPEPDSASAVGSR